MLGVRTLLERQRAARHLAPAQDLEGVVHVLHGEGAGNQLVQLQLARLVEAEQARELDLGFAVPYIDPITVFSAIRSRASIVTGVPYGACPTQTVMPRLRVQTPEAIILTRTSPGPGLLNATSSIRKG